MLPQLGQGRFDDGSEAITRLEWIKELRVLRKDLLMTDREHKKLQQVVKREFKLFGEEDLEKLSRAAEAAMRKEQEEMFSFIYRTKKDVFVCKQMIEDYRTDPAHFDKIHKNIMKFKLNDRNVYTSLSEEQGDLERDLEILGEKFDAMEKEGKFYLSKP